MGGGGVTKRPDISLIIGPRGLESENKLMEIVICKSFAVSPLLQGHPKRALYLPYNWF